MGIPRLNRFLRNRCSSGSIRTVSLNDLRGQRVVIDSSIYLYKYLAEGCYVENLYTLATKLRSFRISALFVFDGKPPEEKQDEILRRYERKSRCYAQYVDALAEYNALDPGPAKHRMKFELEKLRRQFVRLSPEDISLARDLICSYGFQTFDAVGEADSVCARLVQIGAADACLSEDTDLFPFGCPVVLRHLSLADSTVLRYDLDSILRDLGMSLQQFREVCVASGCDYDSSSGRSINESVRLFGSLLKSGSEQSFLDWLTSSTGYISDPKATNRALSLFGAEDMPLPSLEIKLSSVDVTGLRSLLENNGFLFTDQ